MRVFPSPTDNHLNLELPIGEYDFQIFNFTGQMVMSGKILDSDSILIGGFPAGHYIINLTNKKGANQSIVFSKSTE